MKNIISMGIDCGEKTCARSKGNFCHLFRGDAFGNTYCYMFGDLIDEDGWVQRHKDCLEATSSNLNKLGLKKCPHCGEDEDIVIRTKTYNDDAVPILKGSIYNYVECLPCDAQTGWCFDVDASIEGFEDGKEMAKFYWNLRGGKIE